MLVIANLIISSIIGIFLLFSGYSISKFFFKEETSFFCHIITGLILICSLMVFPSLVIGNFTGGLKEYFLFVIAGFALCSSYLIVSVLRKNPVQKIRLEVFVIILLFAIIVFLRPLLLLGGGGIIAWDSLHSYIPMARQIFELNRIPIVDLARPGLTFTRPPLVMLLYSFSYVFAPSLETSLAICIISFVGLGLISAEFIYRKERTLKVPLLAMAMTISMPLLNFFFYDWGTYLDLPFSFFFLSSIYFLVRALEGQSKKYSFLFWASFSLAMLTKETAIPFSLAYLIVLGFYSSRGRLSVLLANFVIGTYILLGVLKMVPFDWVPIDYVILAFLVLLFLQMRVSSGVKSTNTLLVSLKSLLDRNILLMSFSLFWLARSWFISGSLSSAFSLQVSVTPYIVFAIIAFVLLFLIFTKYYPKRKKQISAPEKKNINSRLSGYARVLNILLIIFFLALGLFYLVSLKIFDVETIGFTPLSPIIYFFLSGWFGSAFILPKIYGAFVGLKENDREQKMLLCLTFYILLLWSIIGLTSIRYVVALVPISSIITIKGLSGFSSFVKLKSSLLTFLAVLCAIILFASFNYVMQPYQLGISVWYSDILKEQSVLPESLAISILFTLSIILVMNGSRVKDSPTRLMRKKISRVPNTHFTELVLIGIFLSSFVYQIYYISDLQYQWDTRSNTYNMGYKQLLEDLSTRFGPNGTILTPVPETGTTYWSNFEIINLNDRVQLSSLGIDKILKSNNLTLLFDFYKKNNIKFLILPTSKNWYYQTVNQQFINQTSYLEKYYPNISLLLESTKHLISVDSPRYYNTTLVSACESTSNWYSPGESLSVDAEDYKQGNGSLRFSGNPKSDGWFPITFYEGRSWNWSDKDLLSIWIKCESNYIPNFFSVCIHSSAENGSQNFADASWWNLRYYEGWSSGDWFKAILPLRNPDSVDEVGANLSNVGDIVITLHVDVSSNVTLHVDDISLSNFNSSYIPFTYDPYDFYEVFLFPQ